MKSNSLGQFEPNQKSTSNVQASGTSGMSFNPINERGNQGSPKKSIQIDKSPAYMDNGSPGKYSLFSKGRQSEASAL